MAVHVIIVTGGVIIKVVYEADAVSIIDDGDLLHVVPYVEFLAQRVHELVVVRGADDLHVLGRPAQRQHAEVGLDHLRVLELMVGDESLLRRKLGKSF